MRSAPVGPRCRGTGPKLEPFFKTQPYITMIMKKKAERQEERSVGALVVVKDRRFQETAFRPQRARNIGHLSGDRSLANAPELVGLGVNGDPQFCGRCSLNFFKVVAPIANLWHPVSTVAQVASSGGCWEYWDTRLQNMFS